MGHRSSAPHPRRLLPCRPPTGNLCVWQVEFCELPNRGGLVGTNFCNGERGFGCTQTEVLATTWEGPSLKIIVEVGARTRCLYRRKRAHQVWSKVLTTEEARVRRAVSSTVVERPCLLASGVPTSRCAAWHTAMKKQRIVILGFGTVWHGATEIGP